MMDFYHVKDDYIRFLRQYDPKVAENKQGRRPYVGVVVDVDGIPYYAPFTSPKKKHLSMKNSKDFRKIQQGQLGAINFNNMIPIPFCALVRLHIADVEDLQYRRLLQNQYAAIRADWKAIEKTARELHRLVMAEDDSLSELERKIKARCCDFGTLEKVFHAYGGGDVERIGAVREVGLDRKREDVYNKSVEIV